MNKEQRTKMMGEEKIPKVLITLALPAIIGLLVTAIYNIVDTLFVSFLGTEAIGAVSVVYPLFMILAAVGLTYGIGSASFVSRLLGENKRDKANHVLTTTTITSAATALILTLILLVFLEPILRMLGATDTIMPHAISYARILVFGGIFTIINMTLNNLLRAEGSAKYSMIALLTGAILNIIFDPIFIFVFDMGTAGAAVATVLSQATSTILLFSFYLKKKSVLHLAIKHFKPSKKLYTELYKIGIPTFIRQFLMSMSMGLLNTAAMPFGDAAIASLGITMKVFSLAAMVIFGFAQGFQPVAGYNYGAGAIDRLKESIKVSLLWTSIFTTVATVVYMIFAPQIISVFTNDPEVLRIGVKALRALVLFFPFFGFQTVYATLFQALGKAKQAALLSLARQGIFLIPAIMILPGIFQLNGVIYAQAFADFCTIILTFILAKHVHKEIHALDIKKLAA